MTKLFKALAATLVSAAHSRAQGVMCQQAQAQKQANNPQADDYRANAGGWN